VLLCLGDYQAALADFDRAAALWDEPARRLFRTFALDNRADVLTALGRYEPALAVKDEALPLYREFGYRIAEAECLAERGAILAALGRAAEAEGALQEALRLSEALGDRYDLVQALLALAELRLSAIAPEAGAEALELGLRAVAVGEEAELPHGVIHGLRHAALAALALGRPEEARGYAERASELLAGAAGLEGPAEAVHLARARVLAACGDAEGARAALASAEGELAAKAARITDPALRRSFLDCVPTSRAIRGAAASLHGADSTAR
jgi:tetratricopeptide (TPR) repeat protein